MDKELFNELLTSCNEAIDYEKGNNNGCISHIVEIPDDDIINMYSQLTENDKYFVRGMIQRLLQASSQ